MKTKTNNAFTIVELVVAMGLLVMLVGLSSVVFSTTVKAHRKATATIEITRNLGVVTGQLNTDLRGLRTDAPLMFWFDSRLSGSTEKRFDMMHFFADGDFQTTGQYDYDNNGDGTIDGSKTIVGNIARVFYGHANSDNSLAPDFDTCHVLSRKSHILTADNSILSVYGEIPLITDFSGTLPVLDYSQFADSSIGFGVTSLSGNYLDENELEFNTITLTSWINALNYLDSISGLPDNADTFINQCMDDNSRPYIDLTDYDTLHLLMAQGVMDFSVQWAYTPQDLNGTSTGSSGVAFTAGVRWWPSVDPDGDGDISDSDFAGMMSVWGLSDESFGVHFTLPNGTLNTTDSWFTIGNCGTGGVAFSSTFYPKALKFTFRLKDSNNIFSDGKTFTHIVYLDN